MRPPMLVLSGPTPRRRLAAITCFSLTLILLISVGALHSSSGITPHYYKTSEEVYQQSPTTSRSPDTSVKNTRRLKDTFTGQLRKTGQVTSVSDHVSGHAHSLTRLGSQLRFDLTTCPAGSKMLIKDWQNVIIPRTSLCPKLFIIGAKKGGTTSLYNYISQHPDFKGIRLNVSVMIGETAYFARRYKTIPLNRYLAMFPRDRMSGDASVDNLVQCHSPQRILKTCGDRVKIVLLLRDPIDRYVSNFMMRVARPEYKKYNSFSSMYNTTVHELAVLKKAAKKKGVTFPFDPSSTWSKLRCIFGCCDSMIYEGLYYVFLMNWLCNFPAENLMIINSKEFFHSPALILQQVIEFVELRPLRRDTLEAITSRVYNKGTQPHLEQHQLGSDQKEQLNSIYKPFNTALLRLLNWEESVSW